MCPTSSSGVFACSPSAFLGVTNGARGAIRQSAGSCFINQPNQFSLRGLHLLRWEIGGAVLEDLVEDCGLVGSAGQKINACGGVQDRESEGDALGVEFWHPVGHHQTLGFVQRGSAREKGSRMPVGSDPQEDQIETRTLQFLLFEPL